ncbi:hypothetical protein PVAND_005063 [Polypedilum vanderplanki]|uniref:Uncharacterized protein n=1 Tax=Polypedilum vanderplanki TaxID=319348 RepID=A0A9J6C0X2_POLVA|nr:hypothetical protein PVAND_005063 [Polypedilum vanderplanki]
MIKLDEIAAPTTILTTEQSFLNKIKNRVMKKPNSAIVDYTEEWRNGNGNEAGNYKKIIFMPISIKKCIRV